jgi:TetR/AcrR family transcriptional regulator, repressor for uid operon
LAIHLFLSALQNEHSFFIRMATVKSSVAVAGGGVPARYVVPRASPWKALFQHLKGRLMPKVKPETLAARRDEILVAAERCFARQGFHQTTVQHVIKESGLSAGCIYSHFASKEELIQAIGERRHARDGALLALDDRNQDPLESLRAIARAFLGDLQKEQGLRSRRVALQLWAEALRDDVIREQVTNGIRKPIALIMELLRRGQRLGLIERTANPRAIARAMVSMFQGYVLQRLWGEPFSTAAAMSAFDMLLAGIATKSPPARAPRGSADR